MSVESSLGKKVVRGATFLLGANVAARTLGALSIVMLARILTPSDYGVVALALVVIGFADMLTNFQYNNALVRLPEIQKSHFDTVFTLTLLRGLLTASVIFCGADLIATVMSEPRLASTLRLIALVPLLDGLRNPRIAQFTREVNFLPEVTMELSGRAVSILSAIALAFWLRSYWALIIGQVLGAMVAAAVSYAPAPTLPAFSLRHWKEFFAFGGWMSGVGIVNYVNYKSETTIIGANLGAAAVGAYNLADQMGSISTTQLSYPLVRAIYPGFATMTADTARLRAAHRKAQSVILGLLLPTGVGAALTAPEIVMLLMGPQWDMVPPIMAAITPIMAVALVASPAQAVGMALGDTRAVFNASLANLVVRLPIVVTGFYLGGLMGVVYARIVGGLLGSWIMLRLGLRKTEDTLPGVASAFWRSFVACAAMAAVVMPLPDFSDSLANAAIGLAIKASLGAATYFGVHFLLWRLSGRPDGVERLILNTARKLLARLARRGAQAE